VREGREEREKKREREEVGGKFRRNNSHERNDGMNGINRIMKIHVGGRRGRGEI
jgi:hypothetical protein